MQVHNGHYARLTAIFPDNPDTVQNATMSQLCQITYHTGHTPPSTASFSQAVNTFANDGNPFRLLFVRLRRLLIESAKLAPNTSLYYHNIKELQTVTESVFRYIFAWIWFVPRLSKNFFLIIKHTSPCPLWMSREEQSLGYSKRFWIQIYRRWFDIARDLAWMIAGLIQCFILTGPLTPLGTYVSIAQQCCDLFLFALRAYIEITRLKKMQDAYKVGDEVENQAIKKLYIAEIQQQIKKSERKCMQAMINAGVLIIALSLMTPLCASYPILAVIGAAIAVLTTIITIAIYIKNQYDERAKRAHTRAVQCAANVVVEESTVLSDTANPPAEDNVGATSAATHDDDKCPPTPETLNISSPNAPTRPSTPAITGDSRIDPQPNSDDLSNDEGPPIVRSTVRRNSIFSIHRQPLALSPTMQFPPTNSHPSLSPMVTQHERSYGPS